jgi:ATP-dependent Lon protease
MNRGTPLLVVDSPSVKALAAAAIVRKSYSAPSEAFASAAAQPIRKHTFTEILDRNFSLGSNLKSSDVKAVRKTVSGLVKLIYPNGELPKEELTELVELSLEGRRRVKEQLKKMGSFEFHQTSFSLIDNETREEKFVGVPEQGGRDMISLDPLAPGSVYTSSRDDHAKVGLYRLEVGCSPGTGKLKVAGGVEGLMRESINRAFAYMMGQKVKLGVSQQVDGTDFHVEAIDLLNNHVPCEAGIALVVAIYSAIKRLPVQAGLVILGDLSIQGNVKPMLSLAEPLQVAMDNGARKALIPLENKRSFLEVSGDIVERVDPVFFSDPMTAAMKALGMT